MEVWKKIKGYDYYEVSNNGNVKSNHKRSKDKPLLNLRVTKKGYRRVKLSKNGKEKMFLVHRLVAEAFIPNPKNKPFVNHKNGLKNDNNLNNLEWVTAKENSVHAVINKLNNPLRGENNGNSKLDVLKVIDIRTKYDGKKHTFKSLSKEYNVSKTLIGSIVNKKIWKHI
jgi:hypothetical protein